jgi:hypothetical protein
LRLGLHGSDQVGHDDTVRRDWAVLRTGFPAYSRRRE